MKAACPTLPGDILGSTLTLEKRPQGARRARWRRSASWTAGPMERLKLERALLAAGEDLTAADANEVGGDPRPSAPRRREADNDREEGYCFATGFVAGSGAALRLPRGAEGEDGSVDGVGSKGNDDADSNCRSEDNYSGIDRNRKGRNRNKCSSHRGDKDKNATTNNSCDYDDGNKSVNSKDDRPRKPGRLCTSPRGTDDVHPIALVGEDRREALARSGRTASAPTLPAEGADGWMWSGGRLNRAHARSRLNPRTLRGELIAEDGLRPPSPAPKEGDRRASFARNGRAASEPTVRPGRPPPTNNGSCRDDGYKSVNSKVEDAIEASNVPSPSHAPLRLRNPARIICLSQRGTDDVRPIALAGRDRREAFARSGRTASVPTLPAEGADGWVWSGGRLNRSHGRSRFATRTLQGNPPAEDGVQPLGPAKVDRRASFARDGRAASEPTVVRPGRSLAQRESERRAFFAGRAYRWRREGSWDDEDDEDTIITERSEESNTASAWAKTSTISPPATVSPQTAYLKAGVASHLRRTEAAPRRRSCGSRPASGWGWERGRSDEDAYDDNEDDDSGSEADWGNSILYLLARERERW